MKKIILAVVSLSLFAISCNKESEHGFVTDSVVPKGWDVENQIIVIEGKSYKMKVAGDPNGRGIKFLNEPKEMYDFFVKHDDTFVPHAVYGEDGMVVFYYKNWDDFVKTVQMKPIENDIKNLNEGSISYEHSNSGGTQFKQNLVTWKGFEFNNSYGIGQSSSYVGNSFNDKFTEVLVGHYACYLPAGSSTPCVSDNYMGCEHSNWGGRRVVLTVSGWWPHGDVRFRLNTIQFTRANVRSWNDEISSCETWRATYNYNSSHWNNPTF
jgi:hypothetical protein